VNKKPNSDRSSRAQKRRAEREETKSPAQPQGGIPAKEVFSQLGELQFRYNTLVEANARLGQELAGKEAAIENLNALIEKLTPKSEPQTPDTLPEMMEKRQEPTDLELIEEHLANQRPSEEEVTQAIQAKQESEEEERPLADIIGQLPRDASDEKAKPLED